MINVRPNFENERATQHCEIQKLKMFNFIDVILFRLILRNSRNFSSDLVRLN